MSPVIATVILVAVAITVAVAVAYWMGGIAGQYTKFEKVEIQSGNCILEPTGAWTITLKMKNTGTATATLLSAYINDVEVYDYGVNIAAANGTATNMTTTSTTIESGALIVVELYIDDTYKSLSSGTTINIKIHSAGGMDYIKLVELV